MRSMRQIHLAHLNDKYFKGNAVYAPWGLSPCVTSAAGCGGGHLPLLPYISKVE